MMVVLMYLKKLMEKKGKAEDLLSLNETVLQSSLFFLKSCSPQETPKTYSRVRNRVSVSPPSVPFSREKRSFKRLSPLEEEVERLGALQASLMQRVSGVLQTSEGWK